MKTIGKIQILFVKKIEDKIVDNFGYAANPNYSRKMAVDYSNDKFSKPCKKKFDRIKEEKKRKVKIKLLILCLSPTPTT